MHMQHNPLASGKPDPPGPEYLLMTSVCQPHDGRNVGRKRERKEVGRMRSGGGRGKVEMERGESMRCRGWEGGQEGN